MAAFAICVFGAVTHAQTTGYLKLVRGTDTISLDKSMLLGNSYTYEFRIRFYGVGNPSINSGRLFSQQNGWDTDMAVEFSYSGLTPRIQLGECCQAPGFQTPAGLLTDQEWHHVAMVRYPTEWRLYIDGSLQASGASYGSPGAGANLGFGCNRSIGGFQYAANGGDPTAPSVKADVDWIKISSVSRYFNNNFSPPTEAELVSDSNTQLLYKFNEQGVTTILDESPNRVTGTFAVGFPSATAPELVHVQDADMDHDGILNEIDNCPQVYNPQQEDCDGNGVGDACEIDCNGNGLADVCEIANGTVTDCNNNGIPDSCDILSGALKDCNLNGIADVCEIANGTVTDVNQNGIPDSCDVVSGLLNDYNHNGIADSAELITVTAQLQIVTSQFNAVTAQLECGDLNNDGSADSQDLGLLLLRYGACQADSLTTPQEQEPMIFQTVESAKPR